MSWRLRSTWLAGAVIVCRIAPGWAACPSYTAGTGTHHCGVTATRGTNPTAEQWRATFALVAGGPKKWGSRGPSVPNLKSGCGAAEKRVPATFPCEILKAVAQKESNWKQFCSPTEPASERGKPAQTLIAFDCGYGVSQVTSGMREGEATTFDRARVASDPVYNMAVGAGLLAQKWQGSRCIETRDPGILEHWYVALWKYNGYSYSNDPSNPIFSSSRGVYNPAVGGAAPYQEKVFGIVENGSNGGKLWAPIALAYPRLEDVAGRRSEPVEKIECGSPTDCAAVTRRTTHRTSCTLTETAGAALPPPPPTAGPDGGPPKPAADASAPAAGGGKPVADAHSPSAGDDPAGAAPTRPESRTGGCSGGCSGGGALTAGGPSVIAAVALAAFLLIRLRRR